LGEVLAPGLCVASRGVLGKFDPVLEPEFMPLEEQRELFAQRIKGLGRFQFLFRPAVTEGQIETAVLPLTIQHEDCDPRTGERQYPDSQLIERFRKALAAQSGMPVKKLLAAQDALRSTAHLPQAQHTLNQSPTIPPPAPPASPTVRRYRIS
jgi:hypothetical protein